MDTYSLIRTYYVSVYNKIEWGNFRNSWAKYQILPSTCLRLFFGGGGRSVVCWSRLSISKLMDYVIRTNFRFFPRGFKTNYNNYICYMKLSMNGFRMSTIFFQKCHENVYNQKYQFHATGGYCTLNECHETHLVTKP